jgi:transposase
VEVFLTTRPVDLRWSFDRLAGVAQSVVGRSARSGALFVFVGKRRDACKVLFFDGSGLCLFYKRLDTGVLRLPACDPDATSVAIEEWLLDALLDGIEAERAPPKRRRMRLH